MGLPLGDRAPFNERSSRAICGSAVGRRDLRDGASVGAGGGGRLCRRARVGAGPVRGPFAVAGKFGRGKTSCRNWARWRVRVVEALAGDAPPGRSAGVRAAVLWRGKRRRTAVDCNRWDGHPPPHPLSPDPTPTPVGGGGGAPGPTTTSRVVQCFGRCIDASATIFLASCHPPPPNTSETPPTAPQHNRCDAWRGFLHRAMFTLPPPNAGRPDGRLAMVMGMIACKASAVGQCT